ncbi:hypothetical protein GCM10009664_28470 [Kitasatospora gansuensis]
MPTPAVCSRASPVSSASASERSRRDSATNTALSDWVDCGATPVRMPSGPISTNRETPTDSRYRTFSENRTASRTWLTQYSGSVTLPLATTGIFGSANVSPETTARN